MNISDEWNRLREKEHTTSFENLGEWLNQNTSKPRKMKTMYKVVASVVITATLLVACSMPVEQEEEIGYMIKGVSEESENTLKQSLSALTEELSQISINQLLIEDQATAVTNEPVYLTEMVMVLADADYDAAVKKRDQIAALAPYQSLKILPIEETVRVPFYEKALNTFDIKIAREVPDSVIAYRIDEFLHENSATTGKASVTVNEEGERIVEIIVEEIHDGTSLESTLQIKRSVEKLHNGLSPRLKISTLDSVELMELKQKEIEAVETIKVIKEKQQ